MDIFALYFVSVRIIAKKTLREFWLKHADVESSLKTWYHDTEVAKWKGPADIRLEYPSASFLEQNRVVFNVKGNRYRLIVRINYKYQLIWIRFIGTHAQYDKIDASKV